MVFGLFRSKSDVLKEKIIFTQKNRIGSLEDEVGELKKAVRNKDSEVSGMRTNFDRSKDRLVEQIIDLSDKFADINQRMLDMAAENARFKLIHGNHSGALENQSRKRKKKR